PELSVESVAMRQRVSPRYVQMLFEQEGTTFSQYVIGERLVCAYRMLTNPLFADRSITSVAFDAGFGDLSYFSRAFRRCYGATPSEVRVEAGQRASIKDVRPDISAGRVDESNSALAPRWFAASAHVRSWQILLQKSQMARR